MRDEIEVLVRKIKRDSQSGASLIAQNALDAIRKLVRLDGEATELEELYLALIEAQSDMGPIYHLVEFARGSAKLLEDLHAYEEERKLDMERVVQNGIAQIVDGDVIFTHSQSSVIQRVLCEAAGSKSFQVIVSESRPLMEGRDTALALVSAGVETTLIVDSALMLYLPRCTKVFVGADALLENHFVNKVGTHMIGLAAKSLEKPLYVLAQSTKRMESIDLNRKMHCSDEVFETSCAIHVENPYYEMTPLELVTSLISEKNQ